jgi:hypothetical protein
MKPGCEAILLLTGSRTLSKRNRKDLVEWLREQAVEIENSNPNIGNLAAARWRTPTRRKKK